MGQLDSLEAISPVDGRYGRKTRELREFFSEKALMRYRSFVEAEYLIALSEFDAIIELTEEEEGLVRSYVDEFDLEKAQVVKDIEVRGHGDIPATNHDVKAVEYGLRNALSGTSLSDVLEFIHFGLTSEDVTNIAYALMLSDGIEQAVLPHLKDVYTALVHFAQQYKDDPMLGRTHGQPATSTTVGKEFAVFANRLERQMKKLDGQTIQVKLNGSTGNYTAHHAAFPEVDWENFTETFVRDLNNGREGLLLEVNPVTTQIESHDSLAEIFDTFKRANNILVDCAQDMWRYISDDWFKLKVVEGEVGSSVMPQKVNPIDFENAEGNLPIANVLFTHFADTLAKSRLQRDLSDSTVKRNIGSAFGYSVIGYQSMLKGLGKIEPDTQYMKKVLYDKPEVVTEGIQTILRREGVPGAYENIKAASRGKKVTLEILEEMIRDLPVAESVKNELRALTPSRYTGLAKEIVENAFPDD